MAAALLGIHANTSRRRIRTGRFTAVLAPGPAGQEYRLTGATVEALRRELSLGGWAPQLRPDPVRAARTPPAPSFSESDSGSHLRSVLGSVIRSDPGSDPGSHLEHGPRPGALDEQSAETVPAGDERPAAPVGAPAAVAALEAAHRAELRRAELRRVEELVAVLRDELAVRRQKQAEERDAHRREVAQLHTLLA